MNDKAKHEDDGIDDVETELRQFAPRKVSADFKERVQTALVTEPTGSIQPSSGQPNSSHRTLVWTFSIAIAASLVIGAFIALGGFDADKDRPRLGDTTESNEESPEPVPIRVPNTHSLDRPTILAYRRAFTSSEKDLDELLDRHAHALFTPSNLPMDPLPLN